MGGNWTGGEEVGDEVLSCGLVEVLCMRRVMECAAFRRWFDACLPGLAAGDPSSLFTPAIVSDRSDGKIAHLDGFNLSRAWCWRGLADALDPVLAARALETADPHLDASLPRSEEHTSELQSLMRTSYAVFCLKQKKTKTQK